MAYSTVTASSNSVPLAAATSSTPANVITVQQEKDFVLQHLFKADTHTFRAVNQLLNIYEENDAAIPLTSVIYTPNRRFFENSKFYKNITNSNKLMAWLKKRNIIVLVYDVTANLDNSLHTQNAYADAALIVDIMQTSGCLPSFQSCIPTIFKPEHDVVTNNEDMINLLRFENSSFNYRLQAIRDRIHNVYSYNFSAINYLVFNDLNSDTCIQRFLKNTINVALNG